MTLKDADLALTFACPICAVQPPNVCPHIAERLALAESVQSSVNPPTVEAFDRAAEGSGLV
jgi:hypothetical protein